MSNSRQYSREDCLEAIRRVTEELGSPPTKKEYMAAEIGPSETTIRKVLGVSFAEAREMAGLDRPHENDRRKVELTVDYFEELSTPDRAYWAGTLWGHSSQSETNNVRSLVISHHAGKRHFVEEFYEAIEAGYKLSEYEHDDPNRKSQIQFVITNQSFIDHLHKLGLTDSARNVSALPDVPEELRRHFVRGFLEVKAQLSGDGVQVVSNHREKLETLGEWIEDLGVQRTYIGELSGGQYSFRVGSIFDTALLFETCWVDLTDPSIRFESFYTKGLESICREHPYPENLSFCKSNSPDEKSHGEERRTDPDSENDESMSTSSTGSEPGDDSKSPAMTASGADQEQDMQGAPDSASGRSVLVPPSLIVAAADIRDECIDPEAIVGNRVVKFTRELVGGPYPEVDVREQFESPDVGRIDVSLELPSPTRVAIDAIVRDDASPFDSIDEYVIGALCETVDAFESAEHRLTVDRETAALLRAVVDDDVTTGAIAILEEAIGRELDSK